MRAVERLIGVYDADGGVAGELRYLFGKLRGRSHCGLCDITHGALRQKAAFATCAAGLGVVFELVHRNERSAEVLAASNGREPCVLALADGQLQLLLGREELTVVSGGVRAFEIALRGAARDHGLTFP